MSALRYSGAEVAGVDRRDIDNNRVNDASHNLHVCVKAVVERISNSQPR